MFTNLLIVCNDERRETLIAQLPDLMKNYYETIDSSDKKRVRESARQRFHQIMEEHKRFDAAKEEFESN